MCIIVAKEKKVGLPTIETLKTCFEHNNDGAGFMYVNNGKVVIDKGYMSFDSFKRHYEKLCKKFNDFKDKALVMHFRIGTSGTNTGENTHPYCISTDYRDLHKTNVLCSLGVVHNGIITQYNPKDTKNNTNDTQEFIMKYLAPLYANYKDFYKNEYIMSGIEDIIMSKLTFLDTEENLYYVGDFEEENGVKYSNSSYKEYTHKTYSKYYSPVWDEDEQDYLKSCGYVFDKEEECREVEEKDLMKLEPNWFIGNGYGIEKVGDRELYIDIYEYDLYEKRENNTYFRIGRDTYVYDEQYLEIC